MSNGLARSLNPVHFEGRIQGCRVGLFELESTDGMRVAISNYGARILQLIVPDARGQARDVVLGYENFTQMTQGLPSMGAFMGRYANRIAQAQMPWEGRTWSLPANDGPHCLHGGWAGSRHQVFEVLEHSPEHVCLGWTFLEAVDGFPGDVDLRVRYEVKAPGVLSVHHEALPRRRATVLNFTCHPFFNLEGHDRDDVLGHQIQSDASWFLPVTREQIPRGDIADVAGTAFDFRTPLSLGQALAKKDAQLDMGRHRGFDHFHGLALTAPGGPTPLRCMATIRAPGSGIALSVWSDAPGFQFYSGGGLVGDTPAYVGKGLRRYGPCAGFCLEPQGCPDAPNHPQFPSTRCEAFRPVRGRVDYRFSC
jgi:aldose 1-epimerase